MKIKPILKINHNQDVPTKIGECVYFGNDLLQALTYTDTCAECYFYDMDDDCCAKPCYDCYFDNLFFKKISNED